MKTFATFTLFAASVATAQVTYNSTTNVFTCPANNPNGAFCSGESLQTNIIIRCTNGIGQPGNCNDNLAGEFPQGVNFSPCWETGATSGNAACSKNCIVYGGSGNFNGTFTLPDCTAISSTSSASSTSASSTASSTSSPTTTTITSTSTASSSLTSSSTTATITTTNKLVSTTEVITYTTTYCPSSTLSTIVLQTGTGGGSTSSSNGTQSTGGAGGVSSTQSTGGAGGVSGTQSTGGAGGVSSTESAATKTPVGPTTSTQSSPAGFTGGASVVTNSAGSVLAVFGLAIAFFL